MRTFNTDSKNDLYLGDNGNISLSTNLEAVLQVCGQVAKAQLQEMVLATNQGIPNFQTVWNGSPNIAQFEASLRVSLLAVTDVTGVPILDVSFTGNDLFYTATIDTLYGQGTING